MLSAMSSTALAMSETSARVGRGLVYIDSTIWVATIRNLPWLMHFVEISFCISMSFYKGVSIPKSPRATIIPSEASIISSMFYNA